MYVLQVHRRTICTICLLYTSVLQMLNKPCPACNKKGNKMYFCFTKIMKFFNIIIASEGRHECNIPTFQDRTARAKANTTAETRSKPQWKAEFMSTFRSTSRCSIIYSKKILFFIKRSEHHSAIGNTRHSRNRSINRTPLKK